MLESSPSQFVISIVSWIEVQSLWGWWTGRWSHCLYCILRYIPWNQIVLDRTPSHRFRTRESWCFWGHWGLIHWISTSSEKDGDERRQLRVKLAWSCQRKLWQCCSESIISAHSLSSCLGNVQSDASIHCDSRAEFSSRQTSCCQHWTSWMGTIEPATGWFPKHSATITIMNALLTGTQSGDHGIS